MDHLVLPDSSLLLYRWRGYPRQCSWVQAFHTTAHTERCENWKVITIPMAKPSQALPGIGQPAVYRIRLQGALPSAWNDAVQGMQVAYSDAGNGSVFTTWTGSVPDQAALAVILHLAFMLRMILISVECLSTGNQGPIDTL